MSSKKVQEPKFKEPRHHGSMEPESFMCCGLAEYDGLNSRYFTPEGAIATMVHAGAFLEEEEGCCSHIIMTQAISPDANARKEQAKLRSFVAYVDKHKLGTVTLGALNRNPNSGNRIKPALFAPNPKAMFKWGRDHGMESHDRKGDYPMWIDLTPVARMHDRNYRHVPW